MANSVTIIPLEYFENLEGVPDEQKEFIIRDRRQLLERLKLLEERAEEKLKISSKKAKKEVVLKRKRKPRVPPAPHLRCVAQKRRRKESDDPEQCKRSNKLPKGSTPEEALVFWKNAEAPSEQLFCNSHLKEHELMPGIRDQIQESAGNNED